MISTALNLGSMSPIDIEISGGTPDEAMDYARKIRHLIAGIQGAVDVRIAQRQDAPYLVLDVDRIKASELGLTAEDVIQQVVVALNSSVSINRNFWIDSQSGNQYFVGVQFPEDAEKSLEDVLNLPVKGPGTSIINLGEVVTPRRTQGAVEIHHSGLKQVTNVLVNLEDRELSGVVGDIRKVIAETTVNGNLRVEIKGEYGQMRKTFRDLAVGLALAVLLVYLLLVMLFRSWIGPAVILLTVPMGFMGVVWTLLATGTTFNIQSIMGCIFLVGIAVNNGVLLVEFANQRRLEGLSALDAMMSAASLRFRPILMTFLATVLALLPMAIGIGHGNEANVPLARSVVGGMFTSTTLTLLLVPVIYVLICPKLRPPLDVEAALTEASPTKAI